MDDNPDRWDRKDDDSLEKIKDGLRIGAETAKTGALIALGLVLAAKIIGQAIRDCAEMWEDQQ